MKNESNKMWTCVLMWGDGGRCSVSRVYATDRYHVLYNFVFQNRENKKRRELTSTVNIKMCPKW